ncbi:lysophospholipid acyltransferase family protein [Oceanicoccus sp. KOV_DT_Chl]|uniref:lysophospholipid acyltransferase family protein n=1 Tax=Oceanicoccus sp. KOV_DT_Chl TaxID=1904639 RepID=UPI000C7C9A9E|nr:lysophospholipid acyltransferase family protein [Oceanicoccus sp. KOV_DT_Chl]
MIYQARSCNGAKLAPTNTSGVKALLRALKNGETVGVLPDQTPITSGGDFAPFFGIPALTGTLSFNLIQRTGAKVVVAYAERVGPGAGFKVVFEAVADDIASADQLVSLTALNNAVEQCARKIPEQYQWEYKRFKKQPAGAKKYYRKKK